VDNSSKMVLGLLWRVVTKYHIQSYLTEEELVPDTTSSSNMSRSQKLGHFLNKTTRYISFVSTATNAFDLGFNLRQLKIVVTESSLYRDALLRWCRSELESYNLPLANFTKRYFFFLSFFSFRPSFPFLSSFLPYLLY
jgi:hypothetical protein